MVVSVYDVVEQAEIRQELIMPLVHSSSSNATSSSARPNLVLKLMLHLTMPDLASSSKSFESQRYARRDLSFAHQEYKVALKIQITPACDIT